MSQQVVTLLVIDADTSSADQYARSIELAASSRRERPAVLAGIGVAMSAALDRLRSTSKKD